jgi:capsular exopolysaccharide synthesis family protein
MHKANSVLSLPLSDVTDTIDIDPRPAAGTRTAPSIASTQDHHIRARAGAETIEEANDAYCRLAAKLHQVQQTKPLTTVLIASAMPGEGKSLTAANLAMVLSERYGKRVALIDADLRRPSLHHLFGTAGSPGLIDALGGTMPIRPVRLSDTLCLIPAGRPEPNPLERLSSARLRELLSEQAERSDWVIIDVPPLGPCPDAGLLAGLVDGVVLVVSAGHTPLSAVESAVKSLGAERIVGVVLNRSMSAAARYRYPSPRA